MYVHSGFLGLGKEDKQFLTRETTCCVIQRFLFVVGTVYLLQDLCQTYNGIYVES